MGYFVCQHFLLFCGFSFCFVMVSFTVQKSLSLIRSHLFIFVFIFITLGGGSKKILLQFMSVSVLPMFSSKSFIALALLLHLWCILSLLLCMVLENVLISFFYMQLYSFPSTIYWRGCLFSTVYSCLVCHGLVDCRCLDLSLDFLFSSIALHFSFCANTVLFSSFAV